MKGASRDGVQIAFDVVGAGPPILLLHGFSHDRSIWARTGWVEHLQAEFTVVTPDLRGCGASDKPEAPADYSIEAHIADVEAVLAELGIDRPIVWGWSFGAIPRARWSGLVSWPAVEPVVCAGGPYRSIDGALRVDSFICACSLFRGLP